MSGWSVPGFVPIGQVRIDPVGHRVLARDRLTRCLVTITYLAPELLEDDEFRTRFAADAARLSRLRDARVARVRRYLQRGDHAAVVADHVHGTPLRRLLLDEGAVRAEGALVVLKDALRGLAAAQDAGVAHGDLKPEAVVLTRSGRVRLVDFGLSTAALRTRLDVASPFYLAPEQWPGALPNPPADLYAATALFFECLVGAPPFHADNAPALAAAHQLRPPPLAELPSALRPLVRAGLAKDPDARPAAGELLARVEAVAVRGLGVGWERRGRDELSRLLTAPALPDLPRAAAADRRDSAPVHRPLRLAVVLGGALALAAGLASPPLPGIARLPDASSDASSDASGRPPVMAFPGPPSGAESTGTAARSGSPKRQPHAESAAVNDAPVHAELAFQTPDLPASAPPVDTEARPLSGPTASPPADALPVELPHGDAPQAAPGRQRPAPPQAEPDRGPRPDRHPQTYSRPPLHPSHPGHPGGGHRPPTGEQGRPAEECGPQAGNDQPPAGNSQPHAGNGQHPDGEQGPPAEGHEDELASEDRSTPDPEPVNETPSGPDQPADGAPAEPEQDGAPATPEETVAPAQPQQQEDGPAGPGVTTTQPEPTQTEPTQTVLVSDPATSQVADPARDAAHKASSARKLSGRPSPARRQAPVQQSAAQQSGTQQSGAQQVPAQEIPDQPRPVRGAH